MTRDIIQPKNNLREYREMLIETLDKQKFFLDNAKEQADKGFRFTADQMIVNAEALNGDIQHYTEMIDKLLVKSPMQLA